MIRVMNAMNSMKTVGVLLLAGGMMHAQAKPPEAAFSACDGASDGSQCTVSTPRGELSGSCRQPPRESRLVCVPQGHANGGQRQGVKPSAAAGGLAGRQGGTRKHTLTQSTADPTLLPATSPPITSSKSDEMFVGHWRVLTANGVAQHDTGAYPNRGNPNGISEQSYELRVPAQPKLTGRVTALKHSNFGLSVQGVPFDPGAAEWYQGIRNSQWQYEALSGAVALGIDEHHAHVQPTGAYHYHGLPTGLLDSLKVQSAMHSPLVGWAADGFPIYALHGFSDAASGKAISEQTSSYRLKSGYRPSGGNGPGGRYDGTFIADYEYITGSGSLDECNGRLTQTPEFPNGTYAYFLTEQWPVIPRCHRGTPSSDFAKKRNR